LRGRFDIDVWMEETVPKSHLLLFMGTQQSLLSKDCNEELRLARASKIPRIPIKGLDVDWQELAEIGLSREFGFEFDEDHFENLCADLYKYIHEFKRDRDLLSKEQNGSDKNKLETIILITEMLNSDYYNTNFAENSFKIEELKLEYKRQKITFTEFLRGLTDMLE